MMRAMAEADLLIRSDFAHARAHELARATGRSTTEIVEEALRAWTPGPPPLADADLPPGLAREGHLLVLTGQPEWANIDIQAAIEAARDERIDNIMRCR